MTRQHLLFLNSTLLAAIGGLITACGQESTPSSDSQSIAGYATTIDGNFVSTYVVLSKKVGSGVIERTICPENIKNPDNASPATCTLSSKSVSEEAFVDKLFFNTARASGTSEARLDVGASRKAVVDYWRSQLSEYAPAAAQWLDQNPDVAELFKQDESIMRTLRYLESAVTVNAVSRDIGLNPELARQLLPVSVEGILQAFEEAAQVR